MNLRFSELVTLFKKKNKRTHRPTPVNALPISPTAIALINMQRVYTASR